MRTTSLLVVFHTSYSSFFELDPFNALGVRCLHFRQLSFYYFSFGSRIVGERSNRQTLDSGPDMTAWVEEAADKVLLKKKNLRSLFKEDDCVYGSTSSNLEESLISNEGRANARA